jgi:selenocysteine lyase/cysteine desulfurase
MAAAVPLTHVVCEGELLKGGVSPYAKWNKVWCVVNSEGVLVLYTDSGGKVPKQSVVLNQGSGSRAVPCSSIGSHNFCFLIATDDHELYFSTTDDELVTRWVDAITAVGGSVSLDGTVSSEPAATAADARRRHLYSEGGVPPEWVEHANSLAIAAGQPDLAFLDHAWGAIPPLALYRTCRRLFALYTRFGNDTWGQLYANDIPEACGRVKRIFGLQNEPDTCIEFAANTHQFVTALMSSRWDRVMASECSRPFRVLSSTDEFYSITRQLNRYSASESPRLVVEGVPSDPVETFATRVLEHVRASKEPFDFLYFSQVSYLQRTLLPDLRAFVTEARAALDANGNHDCIIVIDVFNSFAAFPLDLSGLDCVTVCGVLKHMCCGPNLCIGVVPQKYTDLRPFITGWLADPTVLGPQSAGITLGSPVNYLPGSNMFGATPSFNYGILSFNSVSAMWDEAGVTVEVVHEHVLGLHRRFLQGLRGGSHPFLNTERYLYQAPATRSHTLVFVQESAVEAAAAADMMRSRGIAVDNRKCYVRVGFGFNHNPEDVDRLLRAVADTAV